MVKKNNRKRKNKKRKYFGDIIALIVVILVTGLILWLIDIFNCKIKDTDDAEVICEFNETILNKREGSFSYTDNTGYHRIPKYYLIFGLGNEDIKYETSKDIYDKFNIGLLYDKPLIVYRINRSFHAIDLSEAKEMLGTDDLSNCTSSDAVKLAKKQWYKDTTYDIRNGDVMANILIIIGICEFVFYKYMKKKH